jgi:hypothetical protein
MRLRYLSPPSPQTILHSLVTILARGLRAWINLQEIGQRAGGGSKITLAEFREVSVRFSAMEGWDKRVYVPIWSDACVLAR